MNTHKGGWDFSQNLVFLTGACTVVAGASVFANTVPFVREVSILVFLIATTEFIYAINKVGGRSK